MTPLRGLFAAISAIVLFLYGLQSFSRELQTVGGTRLREWLGRVTASRWGGFAAGAVATAVIQSSSAVTSLTTALVDATVISFGSSLGVVLGANVGTTATSWLVSLKLTGMGPFFIVLGALLSALPFRASAAGKAVFYFGLIFFALDLISGELRPLQQQPFFQEALLFARTPVLGVLIGLVFTVIVQSSSVTAGVAILLVQQGLLSAESAIPLVVGAAVGSTSTALIVGLGMQRTARATAISNFLFVSSGAVVFLPFLGWFARGMVGFAGDAGVAVATSHMLFACSTSLAFLLTLDWVEPRLRSWLLGVSE